MFLAKFIQRNVLILSLQKKMFFFFSDSNRAFRKTTYIPLSYKIRSKHSSKIFFEKRIFEKNFFFEMKFLFGRLWPGLSKKLPMYLSHRRSGSNMVLSFWVIVTGPLKRLATYLFHRGSIPNIIRKKKKKKFWKNEILKILKWSFFLGESDWAFKKVTYIPLS